MAGAAQAATVPAGSIIEPPPTFTFVSSAARGATTRLDALLAVTEEVARRLELAMAMMS